MLANFYRDISRNRTGMRFLLGDTIPGEKINDGLGLDFEFSSQLVDTDLICVAHASLGLSLFRLLRFAFRVCGSSLFSNFFGRCF